MANEAENAVTFEERLWAKVARCADDECWQWTASTNGIGYGKIHRAGKYLSAHRVVYELVNGPIHEGLEIDHLCNNRGCVNPAHLEAVPHVVNVLRSDSPASRNALKTRCPHGHEYTEQNTLIDGGGRKCRECVRQRQQGYDQRRRLIKTGKTLP